MIQKKKQLYSIFLITGILILLNALSAIFFLRTDLTGDKRYTLDRSTKRILGEVTEPIIITLYISKDLPPDVNQTVQDFKNLLTEYNHYSKRKISFEHINPNQNEDLEYEAIDAGIHPVPLEIRKKDQLKVQRVFLGAVIQVGDQFETIPLIKPGIAMEYSLSTLIKRLTIQNKPQIGYIMGHGEPDFFAIEQILTELSILYEVKAVDLSLESDLQQYKCLILLSPQEAIPESQLGRLDNYLAKGGSLMIAMNRVQGILDEGIGVAINTGLEKWLKKKGLYVDDSFIIDKKCGTVTVQQQGFFSFPQQVNFPFLPIISRFENHSITDGIESLILKFASPIQYLGDTSMTYRKLACTSKISGRLTAPISFSIGRVWLTKDFLYPDLTVAASLSGKMGGDTEAKICLVGDGNFVVNGFGANKSSIQQDNINFFANAVDWLTDDVGLMSLRTKGVLSRPLQEMSDAKSLVIKYLNFLIPILIPIFYGAIRFRRKRIIRSKRMKPGFVK